MNEESPNSSAITRDQDKRFSAACLLLEQAIQEHAFPGAAFGVLSHGDIVALDAVGRFTYEDSSPQVTASTVFDIASLTKVVATTSAAMILHDRGILDLDMPLGDVLPGFVIGKQPGSPKQLVTLRMLLAHSSGLPAYERFFETAKTPNELLRACLMTPLEAAPMERALYSDIGFLLLGKALRARLGRIAGRLLPEGGL